MSPPVPPTDTTQGERTRGMILLLLLACEDRPPTYDQVAMHVGLATAQAVERHIRQLRREGLVAPAGARKTGELGLTAAGLVNARYSAAVSGTENAFRSQVCKAWGCYRYEWARAVEQVAAELDKEWSVGKLASMDLLRKKADGTREPVRKATSREVLGALKRSRDLAGAAAALKLTKGALEQRVANLFAKARSATRGGSDA